ncbi:MFS transporter [Streptomyces sp. NPDC059506]|uniref:MFS transporter n=1 Tax=Streptomyces TaxID=1883 RepID=UPI0015FDF85D|nr:MFS transporter [Streptomyces sp. SCUT-3]QMV23865.1 MFS transporter [Streptomyces sp. SCUT-3]
MAPSGQSHAADPERTAAALPAHRDGNVLRWLAAYGLSVIGDSIYFLALSWSAVRLGDPTQAGLVMAAGSVPRALLMLGGGVVADRFGPRRVVIGSDLVRCLAVLTAAAAVLVAPGLWLLVPLALVFGVVDALFMPAIGALPPRITTAGELGRVQGMRTVSTRLAQVCAPPLGGLAFALGGPSAAFAAAGVLFAVSLVLLLLVRLGPLPGEGAGKAPASPEADADAAGRPGPGPRKTGSVARTMGADLLDGLRYARRHRLIGPLLAVRAFGDLGFIVPLNIGAALLADARGWGAAGLGWLFSAFGAGAALAGLLVTVRGRLPRAGLLQSLLLLVAAVCCASLAVVPTLAAAVAAMGMVGLSAGVAGTLGSALIQTAADPAYLGRVTSLLMLMAVGLAPLMYPVAGAAVSLWGLEPVFAVCGALVAAAALVGLSSTAVRGAELPD